MSIEAVMDDLGLLSSDPLGFVMYAFPWGEAGTELENKHGPETWQVEVLTAVRDGLLSLDEAIMIARASGHGIGKSALVSWLILWGITTFEDARGVVTANTETQLKTKTWAELGKWFRLFIGREAFELTATKLYYKQRELTWRMDMVPWSERTQEAFAGLHNLGKRIILIFDEASAIPDIIWETAEGALTDRDTQIIWAVFGNPTRNSGRFRECFGRLKHRWNHAQIDARQVNIGNQTQFAKWIADYGIDSDFVRVRVTGTFPRAGSMEFISGEEVGAAMLRDAEAQPFDPLVIGVDVARFGDDLSVIYMRKGRDAKSYPIIKLSKVDTMALAGKVTELYLQYRADAVFVDGGGVGGGVVDRLRMLHVNVIEVQFGGKADLLGIPGEDKADKYANKAAEMWGKVRAWLPRGALPADNDLKMELEGRQYGFNKDNAIQLEKKDEMKKRGLSSPDIADALALTFAYPVVPSMMAGSDRPPAEEMVQHNYDPYAKERLQANV